MKKIQDLQEKPKSNHIVGLVVTPPAPVTSCISGGGTLATPPIHHLATSYQQKVSFSMEEMTKILADQQAKFAATMKELEKIKENSAKSKEQEDDFLKMKSYVELLTLIPVTTGLDVLYQGYNGWTNANMFEFTQLALKYETINFYFFPIIDKKAGSVIGFKLYTGEELGNKTHEHHEFKQFGFSYGELETKSSKILEKMSEKELAILDKIGEVYACDKVRTIAKPSEENHTSPGFHILFKENNNIIVRNIIKKFKNMHIIDPKMVILKGILDNFSLGMTNFSFQ